METTTCTAKCELQVRTLTLHQLAGLWLAALSLLPSVNYSSGSLKRSGATTESSFAFQDPDELARNASDTRAGELTLDYIRVSSTHAAIYISEERPSISETWLHSDLWNFLLVPPNVLELRIHGSNEEQVVEIRDTLEQWAKQHLETSSWQTRLKVGLLAASIVATGIIGAIWNLPAKTVFLDLCLWVFLFVLACRCQGSIPVLRRRTRELRIIGGAPSDRVMEP